MLLKRKKKKTALRKKQQVNIRKWKWSVLNKYVLTACVASKQDQKKKKITKTFGILKIIAFLPQIYEIFYVRLKW